MSKISNRAFLEVEYKDEIGTGLGPTLEFYYLVAQEIKNFKSPSSQQNVWRQMPDNTLFPSPISVLKLSPEELQKIYEVYRLSGMMIAKSISDDRLIDLPLSPLFWDLALGKKMNIFDIERLDPSLYKVFAELQLLANKKKKFDKAVF
jgi:E3 ubiquitin-protein ligase TRIP12